MTWRVGTYSTHVYVGGTEIAVYDSWLNQVLTKLSDPVIGRGLDPLGGYVGFADPFVQNPNTTYDSLHPGEALYFQDANPFDPGSGCEIDGLPIDCSRLARQLENGTVGIQFGAGGKIYNVSNFFGFSGGMWVSVPTPSDPEYDDDLPLGHMKVTDNPYMDVWVPFGGSFSSAVREASRITVVGFQTSGPQMYQAREGPPCDRGSAALARAGEEVANNIPGARYDAGLLRFQGTFEKTIEQLEKAGYYEGGILNGGVFAYNPLDHIGGIEFRTYGSPGFHFKVNYPEYERTFKTYGERQDHYELVRKPGPAIGSDIHIDCDNPVGTSVLENIATMRTSSPKAGGGD